MSADGRKERERPRGDRAGIILLLFLIASASLPAVLNELEAGPALRALGAMLVDLFSHDEGVAAGNGEASHLREFESIEASTSMLVPSPLALLDLKPEGEDLPRVSPTPRPRPSLSTYAPRAPPPSPRSDRTRTA